MPKYLYKCKVCGEQKSYFHSMTEKKSDCEFCNSSNALFRLPSSFTVLEKTSAGSKVKTAIKDFKEDLREQKRSMEEKVWDGDE